MAVGLIERKSRVLFISLILLVLLIPLVSASLLDDIGDLFRGLFGRGEEPTISIKEEVAELYIAKFDDGYGDDVDDGYGSEVCKLLAHWKLDNNYLDSAGNHSLY